MSWKQYIDKVIVINLPHRRDRLLTVSKELEKHSIPYQIWDATLNKRGAYGIFLTLKEIFEIAEKQSWGNILLFEDDVRIINNFHVDLGFSMHSLMSSEEGFDMLFLGANVFKPFEKVKWSKYIFKLKEAVALHAVVYSPQGRKKCLSVMREKNNPMVEPVDLLFSKYILTQENCYITNPMLATQAPGYSDIENKVVDYSKFIEGSYKKSLNQIK